MKKFSYLLHGLLLISLPVVFTGCSSGSSFNTSVQQGCAFCDIVAGTGLAQVILETEELLVIEKIPVRTPVNCLIIPKKHIKNIKDLNFTDLYDSKLGSQIFEMAQKLSSMLTGSQDFYLRMNNGSGAGQTVNHMHMHFAAPQSTWK